MEEELLNLIRDYFKTNIFDRHITSTIAKNSRLRAYQINPIVVKYLSRILDDRYSAEGVAKALYYPRVLGTSINTSFGTSIQRMFVDLGIAQGSMIAGMDIEFTDRIDGRRKWCQLKSGPNNINADDVQPILVKFRGVINLARTNGEFSNVNNNDFIVGVLYGDFDELSGHYKRINESHPVIIGQDFWHRLTGYPDFYDRLVVVLHAVITGLQTDDFFNRGLNALTEEIRVSPLFNFE